MADGGHLEFRVIVNNSAADKDICTKIGVVMQQCNAEMTTRLKVKNRKLIRMTSSNEVLGHKCVDLSDY